MAWNERREAVAAFAARLRSASIALPTDVSNDVHLNCFKAGFPQRLQQQAVLVGGDFDSVLSAVSRLSTAQPSTKETVREIGEGKPDWTEKQPDGSVQEGGAASRFAHVRCFSCQQTGHIARYCPQRIAADDRGPGKGYTGAPRKEPRGGCRGK